MMCVVCTKCLRALRVTGDVVETEHLIGSLSDFWPDKYKCDACGGPAQAFLEAELSTLAARTLRYVDVTPQEAFAALHGLGTPDERTCCEEVVLAMFAAVGIEVSGRQMRGQMRFVIDSFKFPDGSKIYMGASPQGALAYRVTKPHSYVRAVEEQNVG